MLLESIQIFHWVQGQNLCLFFFSHFLCFSVSIQLPCLLGNSSSLWIFFLSFRHCVSLLLSITVWSFGLFPAFSLLFSHTFAEGHQYQPAVDNLLRQGGIKNTKLTINLLCWLSCEAHFINTLDFIFYLQESSSVVGLHLSQSMKVRADSHPSSRVSPLTFQCFKHKVSLREARHVWTGCEYKRTPSNTLCCELFICSGCKTDCKVARWFTGIPTNQ